MNVLMSNKVNEIAAEIMEEKDITVAYLNEDVSDSDLIKMIQPYDGIIIRSKPEIKNKAIIDAAVNLKVIGRAGAGTDNIDTQYAGEKGIYVMNTPGRNSNAVAEHVFALLLGLVRHIPYADSTTKGGAFNKKKYMGEELYLKKLGIVGAGGNIGSLLIKKAAGFGMIINSYDPFVPIEKIGGNVVESLDEIFEKSDYISINLKKKKGEEPPITKEHIRKMKENAVLINAARHDVIEEGALEAVLEERLDLRACIDVYPEDKPANQPLARFGKRVLLTPHLGASTKEAQFNVAEAIGQQFIDYLIDDNPRNVVNIDSYKK